MIFMKGEIKMKKILLVGVIGNLYISSSVLAATNDYPEEVVRSAPVCPASITQIGQNVEIAAWVEGRELRFKGSIEELKNSTDPSNVALYAIYVKRQEESDKIFEDIEEKYKRLFGGAFRGR